MAGEMAIVGEMARVFQVYVFAPVAVNTTEEFAHTVLFPVTDKFGFAYHPTDTVLVSLPQKFWLVTVYIVGELGVKGIPLLKPFDHVKEVAPDAESETEPPGQILLELAITCKLGLMAALIKTVCVSTQVEVFDAINV